MRSKTNSEEQFPLLLFIVGGKRVPEDNKKFFGRRSGGITSGASTIITEWPNVVTSWWITTAICCITLTVILLMFTAAMSPPVNFRFPRCAHGSEIDNNTIHLVHNGRTWSQHQLHVLNDIVENFPGYKIHIITIKERNGVILPAQHNTSTMQGQLLLSKLFNQTVNKTDLPQLKTNYDSSEQNIFKFIANHPNTVITQMSYDDIFENSPLHEKWIFLTNEMRLFAVRVIQLWQYGGLSFDLSVKPSLVHNTSTTHMKNNTIPKNSIELCEVEKLIQSGRQRFEGLANEMVSADNKGLHLETKTPCHAFFGKLLVNLRKLHTSSLSKILNNAMEIYCRMNVIDETFCKDIQIRHHSRRVMYNFY